MEQWVQNIDTKKWIEISCFDTGLSKSFMIGDMFQLTENYDWDISIKFVAALSGIYTYAITTVGDDRELRDFTDYKEYHEKSYC